jgi:hypothetical protein
MVLKVLGDLDQNTFQLNPENRTTAIKELSYLSLVYMQTETQLDVLPSLQEHSLLTEL